MNYPTFLKEVDKIINKSDKDKLVAFIHESARTLPEDKREKFLIDLNNFCSSQKKSDVNDSYDLALDIDKSIAALNQIQKSDRYIESSYNEDWEYDWRDDYYFSDPSDISDDVSDALELLHEALDKEEYDKGYLLAIKLSELNVPVIGDYDGVSMSVMEMISHDILSEDGDEVLSDAVSVTYQANKDRNPAEAMMKIMDNFDSYLTLEEVLESAIDEIDVNSFLPSWIEAIASRPHSYDRIKMLEEAIGMVDDADYAESIASRYASSYPFIYLCILEKHNLLNVSDSKMLEIGLKGLDEVSEDYTERDEIALLTANYAIALDDRSSAEKCWLDAFKSSTNVMNYLRLRLLSDNWMNIRDEVKAIYTSCCEKHNNNEGKRLLDFFDESFDEQFAFSIRKEDDQKRNLSGSVLYNGCALFLLLLSDNLDGKGMEAMITKARNLTSFKAKYYTMGTGLKECESDDELFKKCFMKWKSEISIKPETSSEWIDKIEDWISYKVEKVVSKTERFYYNECVAYIAAFGEMMESLGKEGTKQSLLQSYKQKYLRYRAFVGELVAYGLKK